MTPDERAARQAEFARLLLNLPADQQAAFLARQPPAQRERIERALAGPLSLGWRATPDSMAAYLTRNDTRPYKRWAYVRLLGQRFREAVTGERPRQIWNLPSRYGKSWAMRWGFVWALDRDPATNVIYSTYGDELATEGSVFVRDQLRIHAGILRAELRVDRQRQDRFVTPQGGGLLATGIRSTAAGFGADGLGIDDPLKDWIQAHSEHDRGVVWNQYISIFRQRLDVEPGWVIVCHNRMHEDDLSGRLLKGTEDATGEAWDLLRLPALAEPYDPESLDPLLRVRDPLGRAPGEPIEPERFTRQAVLARHLSLGTYLTAAQEQQRPAPEEGGEIKRAWFRLEDVVPERGDDGLVSWDVKLKDSEAGDYVVGQAWVRTGSDLWLVDQVRGKFNLPTTINAVALMAVRWPHIHRHIVENTGLGPEVIAAVRQPFPDYTLDDDTASMLGMTPEEREAVGELRRRGLGGVAANSPKGPKPVRARAVAPYAEAGNVHLPRRAQWLGVWLDEVASFPNGANDDQVDAYSQAVALLARGPASVSAPAPGGSLPSPARVPRRGGGLVVPPRRR